MRRAGRSSRRPNGAGRRLVAWACAVLAAALAASCGRGGLTTDGQGKTSIPFGRAYDYNNIRVERAVDGDTLKLENGERVRMIGIDTPELHESEKLYRDARRMDSDVGVVMAMGRRSQAFTRSLVEGKRVRVEFDSQRKDKYERLLGYVYLEDGTFVNAEIVRQGYASLLTIPPNLAHTDEFRELYKEARAARRGLWAE